MLTQEQIAQFIAQGVPPATIAAMMSQQQQPAAAPSFFPSGPSELADLRRAPPPSQAGQGFVDDGGAFDGQYRVRVKSINVALTAKGKVFRTVLEVITSSNMQISAGSEREYALFLWNPPAQGEANAWVQLLSDAAGNVGTYTDQFYLDATGEKNVCAGLEFDLSVFTKPQKRDRTKTFTHMRFSRAAAPATATVSATVPPSIPGGAAYAFAPTTAATPTTTAFPPKPAGWPDILPWPPQAA